MKLAVHKRKEKRKNSYGKIREIDYTREKSYLIAQKYVNMYSMYKDFVLQSIKRVYCFHKKFVKFGAQKNP